ncbi:MAG: group II truncated hemoglobin [Candidatus Dormiibacterota bacterium]
MTRVSLFEFAGGGPAFLRLAAAHHQRCLDGPVLNHPFSHPGNPQHVERLAEYWAEVLGGPPTFSRRFGGHSAMLELHAGTEAEADLGSRFVDCFVRAADDAGLPADPEFRDALRAYMEWAVAEVLAYSPAKSQVSQGLPVPHWGWSGLE